MIRSSGARTLGQCPFHCVAEALEVSFFALQETMDSSDAYSLGSYSLGSWEFLEPDDEYELVSRVSTEDLQSPGGPPIIYGPGGFYCLVEHDEGREFEEGIDV